MKHADIHVTGIVQGVGFRPFVYRVARELSLRGYVLNLGDAGVRIVVEGNHHDIEKFIHLVRSSPPSISRIDSIEIDWGDKIEGYTEFKIAQSSHVRSKDSVSEVPPDIAICDDCIHDLLRPDSRWYLYPFTSCAACGPRFSTITSLPYDRPNTTMVDFPLCNTCNKGYTEPLDRRYHAQTTACKDCGPRYSLYRRDAKLLATPDAVEKCAELLANGAILAIQGISGTHLVTITSKRSPIEILRERKKRSQRPFAVMAKNMDAVQSIAEVSQVDTDLLSSWRRPIVLLKKRDESASEFPHEIIAPGLDTIGVMLPYAPLHHLLFRYLDDQVLVMTSANPTGLPMYVDPEIILPSLNHLADYFLLHNRRIHQRADDSVIKVIDSVPTFIRRGRGYVPEPMRVTGSWKEGTIIGLGPEEKVTGTVFRSGYAFITQHIGDTDHIETADFLDSAINHILELNGINEIDAIACDLHPEFLTTELGERMALEKGVDLVRVQHHHAHLAGLMAENGLDKDTIITCITADGYGYGPDGTGWGGEVLVGNMSEYERKGGLLPQSYPGGDLSAVYAARSVMGILGTDFEFEQVLPLLHGVNLAPDQELTRDSFDLLLDSMRRRINTIVSSSTGRFLDAVAAMLGVCYENTYDGECPMKLESIAKKSDIDFEVKYRNEGHLTLIDTTHSLEQILNWRNRGLPVEEISYAAQYHIGTALGGLACDIAEKEGVKHVGFSGGVALNRYITSAIKKTARERNLIPLVHSRIPPGDGGVSFGQAMVAAAKRYK